MGVRKTFRAVATAALFAAALYRRALRTRRRVAIFYGTETGTSKRYASELQTRLAENFDVSLDNIANCSLGSLATSAASGSVAIFVSSTFGNGDAPTAAKDFKQVLRGAVRREPKDERMKKLR